jgi:hypothetical protein
MSVLRILSPAPVIRDHYGTLWHDSQHPIGYILGLVVGPLAFFDSGGTVSNHQLGRGPVLGCPIRTCLRVLVPGAVPDTELR